MEHKIITIEAMVMAEPAKVWEYWTNPIHITNWNFATDDWQCPTASNDLKPGGKYVARMEAKDGSFGFDFEAVYDEVITEQKLAYTMADSRQVTTTFKPVAAGTHITTKFEAEGTNDPEMQRAGWQAILDNFKKYTEAN